MAKEESPYLPKVRTDYHPDNDDIKSSSCGVSTYIPNPAVDDIASNNIVCPEFDYTDNMGSTEYFDLNSPHPEQSYIKHCNS
ncbi:hypothetical protein [Clostridium uliginosum]|uniref:Uncharacterized protein n=1 Tax=Clostridium uliginosum TaxID=119641 RepID=A0A1I1PE78_9CLOT|nr:hypothetical protein [Clostridium uliginosum]SFD08085.1 hypothetical protein SAMN05421842_1193 [Clostridium uliginosum]